MLSGGFQHAAFSESILNCREICPWRIHCGDSHLLVCLVLQGADDLKALGDEGHGFIAIGVTRQACSEAACGKLAIITRGPPRDPFYRLHMRMDDLTQHCVLVRRRDGKGLASVVQGKRDCGGFMLL